MKLQSMCNIAKRESFKDIILGIMFLFAAWAILALQFQFIPVIKIDANNNTVNALNTLYLTLSYSYIAALVFYLVTQVFPTRRRKDILEPIIRRKLVDISRCIRNILLEFHRGTNYNYDVHNTDDTEALLRSKDWFSIVPMLQKYQRVPISYLSYMKVCGDNMKSQISDLIMKYNSVMSASQLLELEDLYAASFFNTIEFISSIPGSSIADTGYTSLINDFIALQKQYLKVEKEFGIRNELNRD